MNLIILAAVLIETPREFVFLKLPSNQNEQDYTLCINGVFVDATTYNQMLTYYYWIVRSKLQCTQLNEFLIVGVVVVVVDAEMFLYYMPAHTSIVVAYTEQSNSIVLSCVVVAAIQKPLVYNTV